MNRPVIALLALAPTCVAVGYVVFELITGLRRGTLDTPTAVNLAVLALVAAVLLMIVLRLMQRRG